MVELVGIEPATSDAHQALLQDSALTACRLVAGGLVDSNQATSPLSTVRSNQLSYRPRVEIVIEADWTRAPTTSIGGHEAIKLFEWRSGTDYGLERLPLT